MLLRPSVRLSAQYLPLVAKKARTAWYRLPPQTRAWVSLEDLIQDGMLHLVQVLIPKHNPRKCRLITYLWLGLDNFYLNKNYFHFAKSRFDGRTVPLLTEILPVKQDTKEITALSGLFRLLRVASPELKREMVRWLLRPDPTTKFNVVGKSFKDLKKEFLALSPVTGFGHEDMHYLMVTETWKLRSAQTLCKAANVAC